eukprot:4693471-Prymnesium_polylepis.2
MFIEADTATWHFASTSTTTLLLLPLCPSEADAPHASAPRVRGCGQGVVCERAVGESGLSAR